MRKIGINLMLEVNPKQADKYNVVNPCKDMPIEKYLTLAAESIKKLRDMI